MKFPPSFATPLDLARVNWEAVRPWVTERVTAILGGVEDDVLIEYLMEQLQGKEV
jgi:serine/arginine repetitive matrix protein 1